MLIKLLILLAFAVLYVIRALLWLARLQQKEYRWDRWRHYCFTSQGWRDLIKIWPSSQDFSVTGLVRPKLTPRIFTIIFLLDFSMLAIAIAAWSLSWWWWLLLWLLILISLPAIIWLLNLPTKLVFRWRINHYLQQAKKRLQHNRPKVIGLTGSYGKTSTKILLEFVLAQKYQVYATQRSYNTRYSLTRDVAQRYQNQDIALIEYAAYKPGEIAWLAQHIQPQWAVVTGFTHQHLALFGSKQRIIQAKSELIQALPENGKVFINSQDSGVNSIVNYARLQRPDQMLLQQVVAYTGQDSRVQLTQPELNDQGQLRFIYQSRQVQTQLVGRRYLTIIKAAIAIALQLKLTDKQIIHALETFQPPDFFVNFYQHCSGYWILDDGQTTNPVAFKDVIKLTQELVQQNQDYQRIILVTAGIIDLGKESSNTHHCLAQQAKPVFSDVFYVGSVGLKSFQQVFTDKLVSSESRVKQQLTSLSSQDLVVVEGWIPIWLEQILQERQSDKQE